VLGTAGRSTLQPLRVDTGNPGQNPDLAVPEQPPNLVTVPADVPRVQQARGVVRPPGNVSESASSPPPAADPGLTANQGWC